MILAREQSSRQRPANALLKATSGTYLFFKHLSATTRLLMARVDLCSCRLFSSESFFCFAASDFNSGFKGQVWRHFHVARLGNDVAFEPPPSASAPALFSVLHPDGMAIAQHHTLIRELVRSSSFLLAAFLRSSSALPQQAKAEDRVSIRTSEKMDRQIAGQL